MGKSSSASSSTDPSDNKHEQKLQAVLLADTFSNAFHPVTLEPFADDDANNNGGAAAAKGNPIGKERPLVLCPLNNVPLLHHTIDFLQGSGVEELFILCSSGADALEGYIRNHAGAGRMNNNKGGGSYNNTEYNKSDSRDGGGGSTKIIWSSKLSITTMRFTDCTNAGE